MIVPNYTAEDLKELPLRAIVAFAARAARRVEKLALLPDGHPERERVRSAVADAIGLAEDFARDSPGVPLEPVIGAVESCQAAVGEGFAGASALAAAIRAAHAAASARHALELRDEPGETRLVSAAPPPNPFPHLADMTADRAALEAFTAAVEAAGAVGHTDAFMNGAITDYEKLRRLDLGQYPQAGQPIDPSPHGPLGPLDADVSPP
jgi:hypothetical protein